MGAAGRHYPRLGQPRAEDAALPREQRLRALRQDAYAIIVVIVISIVIMVIIIIVMISSSSSINYSYYY